MDLHRGSDPQAFIKTLLGLDSTHSGAETERELFVWDADTVDHIESRRGSRADGKFLIDWQAELLSSNGYDALQYPPREPHELFEYVTSSAGASSKDDWTIYYLLLDIAQNTGQNDRPEKYAQREGFSQSQINTVRGYWLIDNDRIEDGMSLLSSPCTVREDDDPFFEKVLLTLSDMRTPEALRWLQYYVDFTKPTLSSPSLRNAFIAALADREFSRAWEWIRNWDFQSDLKIQISEAAVAEGVHYEEDAEDLEAMSAERERLLVVLLDRVFKPQPSRKPLEDLVIAPLDKFEEQILTAYLLDPETNLSLPAFDILHDLLTTRLLSHGRYSEAIDLDRRVTELVRSSQHELASARLKRERRQMVDDMVGLLPRVQRDLLAAEKDLRDEAEAEESMLWASSSLETSSVATSLMGSQGVSVRTEVRVSKRVVSLSGLIPASPRRSDQPSGNLLHAILQNQAIAAKAQESRPNPPSPARRTGFDPAEHRSPRPVQQPRAQSPFSSPVKIPRTVTARAYATSVLSRPSARASNRPTFTEQEDTRQHTEEVASGDESAGEKTPVAVRQQPKSRNGLIAPSEDVDMEAADTTQPEHLQSRDEDTAGNIDEEIPADAEDLTPTKVQRKRKSQHEETEASQPTRTRQASVAASAGASVQSQEIDPPKSIKKPVRRSRAKQAPSAEPYVEIVTSTPPRKTRQKAASVAPQDQPDPVEHDAVPLPKRARRTAATPIKNNVPPPPKRTARQTRSQSVISEATTDGGEEGSHARNLRRSGRLSSVTPVSPVKKAAQAEPGVRTRRAASRQPSEAPSVPEPAKPRRQTARK